MRLLEPVGCMAFMGWDPSWFVDPDLHPDVPLHLCKSDVHYAELLLNMTGNAMSIYHFCPLQISLYATIGHFYKDPEAEESSSSSDFDEDDADGSSASSSS